MRRLTPRECERLQGFGDGYTDVPWNGKNWTPDGVRYESLGNSMAVNATRWLGRWIEMADALKSAGPSVAVTSATRKHPMSKKLLKCRRSSLSRHRPLVTITALARVGCREHRRQRIARPNGLHLVANIIFETDQADVIIPLHLAGNFRAEPMIGISAGAPAKTAMPELRNKIADQMRGR